MGASQLMPTKISHEISSTSIIVCTVLNKITVSLQGKNFDLFKKEKKIQARADQTVSCRQLIQKLDFNQTSQNALYQKDYQPLKINLFKTYNQAHLPVAKSTQCSDTKPMFFLLVFALPLLILTAVMSRMWTRRKRRR